MVNLKDKNKTEPLKFMSKLHMTTKFEVIIVSQKKKKKKIRDQAERAKKDAIQNAAQVSDLLVDAVNSGVQESFINEKRIEHEIRALAVTISRFMKLTNQWLTATRAINTAVKEIGDFENWMKTMEFDCKSITAAIQNIHQA
ncbi:biogenesis of lysosome-related organelles complex 1 subunit 1 [Quercus suber]|uniref:biogenesis of lysosome-related organelles complex 1 subunit 1 n=1 Tax=Quercus suber TaxID=58331 RepID=UPI0032DE6ADA